MLGVERRREMDERFFQDALRYYREQGAPGDQQMLIALLREVQEADGGVLWPERVEAIALSYETPAAVLNALIRRIPSLRPAAAPHRLEMCQTCGKNRELAAFVRREYGVENGGVSQQGGFAFQLVNCMKNCKAGPSIRWDGVLYPRADEGLLRKLIGKSKG